MLVHGFEITKNTTSHVLVSSSHTHTLETGFFWTSKHFLHFFHFFFFLNFLSLPTRQLANSSPTRAGWTQDLFFQLARWPSRCSARRSALPVAPFGASASALSRAFRANFPRGPSAVVDALLLRSHRRRVDRQRVALARGCRSRGRGRGCSHCTRCSCPWWTSFSLFFLLSTHWLSWPLTSVPCSRSRSTVTVGAWITSGSIGSGLGSITPWLPLIIAIILHHLRLESWEFSLPQSFRGHSHCTLVKIIWAKHDQGSLGT